VGGGIRSREVRTEDSHRQDGEGVEGMKMNLLAKLPDKLPDELTVDSASKYNKIMALPYSAFLD